MPVRLLTPPASEPVTLAEAKAHLRLDTVDDDTYVNTLILVARQYVEQACWRGLVTQTWELVLDGFGGEDTLELGQRGRRFALPPAFTELPPGNVNPGGFLPYLELPMGVLASVTSLTYIDTNGVQQNLTLTTDYVIDVVSVPGRVRLAYNKAWPATQSPRWDAVRVQYVVGTAVDAVPAPLKQAILLLISQMYEYRTPEVTGALISPVQFAFNALISPYRLVRIG